MERLQRERDTYTQEAAAMLRSEMSALVGMVCRQVQQELDGALSVQDAAPRQAQKSSLQQMQVPHHARDVFGIGAHVGHVWLLYCRCCMSGHW